MKFYVVSLSKAATLVPKLTDAAKRIILWAPSRTRKCHLGQNEGSCRAVAPALFTHAACGHHVLHVQAVTARQSVSRAGYIALEKTIPV